MPAIRKELEIVARSPQFGCQTIFFVFSWAFIFVNYDTTSIAFNIFPFRVQATFGASQFKPPLMRRTKMDSIGSRFRDLF